MVFSSTIFLFIFLPFVLIINFLLIPAYRNFFLLLVSLLFYAAGEGQLVGLMIFSTCLNYIAGLGISFFKGNPFSARLILGIGITINLTFLIYYKYLNFIFENIYFTNYLSISLDAIVLPIGISFYTFHSISYLIDIHRKGIQGQRNPFDLGLYIAFFPQLIAGPIVRYSDIEEQLRSRSITYELFFEGVIRFIRGLAKKIIIANTCALFADRTFSLPIRELPVSIAWLGIICYSLQIYFDFSGYSDMAIGLAKMFGFNFKENFNYPYIAKSMQDFWRRWHISLSTWFRDYLYIPLGGNQKGTGRTYLNLFIVFFATGLWHGASWNFIIWGLFHGLFLVLEKSNIINTEKMPRNLKHVYVLLVVIIGWVFFRSENLENAIEYLNCLMGVTSGYNYSPIILLNYYSCFVFLLAIIFSTPVRIKVEKYLELKPSFSKTVGTLASCVFYSAIFLLSIMELAQTSYNPFIYFRF